MGADRDQEAHVTFPAEQDAQVFVDAEDPVVGQVTLQLVGPEQWIPRVGSEPTQGGAQQLITRRTKLARRRRKRDEATTRTVARQLRRSVSSSSMSS